MSNDFTWAPELSRRPRSKMCSLATLRDALTTLVRAAAVVAAVCAPVFFATPVYAEPNSAGDVTLGLGVGPTDSGAALGLNLQVNLRNAGWMGRIGTVDGLGNISYLGAGKLWSGDVSDTFSYALHAGLEVASAKHEEIYCWDSGTTTADNWILGGGSCDSIKWSAVGGGASIGASIDAHIGAFVLGLHGTGQAYATVKGGVGAGVLALRLGVAWR